MAVDLYHNVYVYVSVYMIQQSLSLSLYYQPMKSLHTSVWINIWEPVLHLSYHHEPNTFILISNLQEVKSHLSKILLMLWETTRILAR